MHLFRNKKHSIMAVLTIFELLLTNLLFFVGSQSVAPGQSGLKAIKYLGLGYNLLKGNPEGGDTSQAGVDPGLLLTRQILKLSSGDIPKEVVQQQHQTCASGGATSIFYGAKTYQDYLLQDVQTSGLADNYTRAYAFTMSKAFQDIDSNTRRRHDVYRDVISTCNMGHARYLLPPSNQFHSITSDFGSNVCSLPNAYDESAYMAFLDTWGTHIVTEVEIGYRNVTRYRQSIAQLAEAMLQHNENVGTIKEQSYLGYGSIVELNMSKFRHDDFPHIHGGNITTSFSYGSSNTPEPITLKMVTIAEAFDNAFWRNTSSLVDYGTCSSEDIATLGEKKNNIITALETYNIAKGKTVQPMDPDIIIPVTWPKGTYALMKPKVGCPTSPFMWHEGWRVQDTEDRSNDNSWTSGIHLAGSPTDTHDPRLEYCVKTDPGLSEYEREWPVGNYCIMKKGTCPTGFQSGSIHWDDEDTSNNNNAGGTLPDGTYNKNTDIWYCCRADGNVQTEILMPVDKPFYLLRYTAACQQVKGMTVTEEKLHFDTEDSFNKDSCSGAHPYDGYNCGHNKELHFCYYEIKAQKISPIFG